MNSLTDILKGVIISPPPHADKQPNVCYWRITLIDQLLQTGKSYKASEIAKKIENGSYSKRTILNDIEFMKNTLKAPIVSDRSGFRYAEKNYFIKSIPLTEGEMFSVAVLNPLLEQYRNTPLEEQLKSVFQKIVSCLPEKITIDTSFLNPKITFIPDMAEHIDKDAFDAVFNALRNCHTMTFDYRPLKKSTYMTRRIDPYHVVCQRGNWYVIGMCHDKEDVRIFSLGRMKNIFVTSNTFDVPDKFDPSEYFDVEMGVWFAKEPFTVELLADKEIAVYAKNRIWHSDQVVKENEDGSVYIKFKTNQSQEVLRYVLGQGHTIKVLAPPELAEEVQAEHKKAAELYG